MFFLCPKPLEPSMVYGLGLDLICSCIQGSSLPSKPLFSSSWFPVSQLSYPGLLPVLRMCLCRSCPLYMSWYFFLEWIIQLYNHNHPLIPKLKYCSFLSSSLTEIKSHTPLSPVDFVHTSEVAPITSASCSSCPYAQFQRAEAVSLAQLCPHNNL